MQTISIILVAALLFLALDLPPVLSRRTPRDGVDPATEELENTRRPEIRPNTTTTRQQDLDQEEQAPSTEQTETGSDITPCSSSPQGCKKEWQGAEMDQAEYRRLRIEVIKQTILQKLRLKTAPQIKVHSLGLPSVIFSNSEALLPDSSETTDESSSIHTRRANLQTAATTTTTADDDFYGTTKNVFVFPDNTSSQIQCSEGSAVCLSFRLSSEAFSGNVASSHLWLYKQAIPSLVHGTPALSNQTLVVSELVIDQQLRILRRRILSLEDDEAGRSAGGWLRLRIDRAVRRWVTKRHFDYALEISCKGCGQFPVPVSQEEGHQPFLVLSIDPRSSLSRRRRDVDCTNTTSRCCRESFYLSFKEIGWDEWIIQPPGYTANFCKGTCLNDVSTSRYHHTSVMNRYLQNQRAKNEEPVFSLCCTPSKMSAISLIYSDEDQNLFQKSLPNMVVETCDCA